MVICIGREFGSGGHEIGARLAEEMQLHFYDGELVTLPGQMSGLDEERLRQADETRVSALLHRVQYEAGEKSLRGLTDQEVLYRLQDEIILTAAKEGNCILVGRCADYVLQKAGIRRLSVFVTAPFEIRVRRKMEILKRDEQETAAIVRRTDRVRKAYYNYRTNGEWGCPSNYDVCINSASLGIAQTVQAMKNFCIHADLQET